MKHVRLTDITRSEDKGVPSAAKNAADAAADAGLSPRAQIDAARKFGSDRLSYNAHVGARQAQRGLDRMAKKFLPCPLCGGIEGCDHSLLERQNAWGSNEQS